MIIFAGFQICSSCFISRCISSERLFLHSPRNRPGWVLWALTHWWTVVQAWTLLIALCTVSAKSMGKAVNACPHSNYCQALIWPQQLNTDPRTGSWRQTNPSLLAQTDSSHLIPTISSLFFSLSHPHPFCYSNTFFLPPSTLSPLMSRTVSFPFYLYTHPFPRWCICLHIPIRLHPL